MSYNRQVKKTVYLKIKSLENLTEQLQEAAKIIREGGLVAFPTETVYGLGANALNPEAVKSIFVAKNRPVDNPVIVHIADRADMDVYAKDIPQLARVLARQFWPGPLTLVLQKADNIPQEVTAGAQTVTLRLPSHPIAQELIRLAGVPIAAPSANTSGRPSPTTAQHVLNDLDGKVDMIIDGGPTNVGVESTVLDVVVQPPMLLRPGEVTFEELQQLIPDLQLLSQLTTSETQIVRSPGLKYQHYTPKSSVILIHATSVELFKQKAKELVKAAEQKSEKAAILSLDELGEEVTPIQLAAKSPARYAAILFDAFRNFELQAVDIIIAQAIPATGVGRAVMDRLSRAADQEEWL